MAAIVAERLKHTRCAEVVHDSLREQGITVSLSSVKRTLMRHFPMHQTHKRAGITLLELLVGISIIGLADD